MVSCRMLKKSASPWSALFLCIKKPGRAIPGFNSSMENKLCVKLTIDNMDIEIVNNEYIKHLDKIHHYGQ